MDRPSISTLEQGDPRELISRLTPAERARMQGYPAEKRQQDWLLGRVVAKQAVREALVREGRPEPDWSAIHIATSPWGAPRVEVADDGTHPLAVSLSHGHGRAAAWALRTGEAGGLPGVDLERVRPRPQGTLRFYLHPEERGWVEALDPGDGEQPGPRDVAAVLLWALKEAAFKALQPPRGTGLLDVEVDLRTEYDAAQGEARIAYRGRALERATLLGVQALHAGWTRRGAFVLAWAEAQGARAPDE